ncbi:MAG: AsmA-like C-terminal region-containing protein [Vicinamibacterales bacterium]
MLRRLVLLIGGVAALLVIVTAAAAYWFFARDGFRQALEAQATAWLGHPVRISAARVQFLPRLAVELRDVRVGEPVQLTLDDIDLASDLRPLFNGRIENADVAISGSRIDLPLPFGLPEESGRGAGADSGAPVRIVSIKSIALRSVRLRSRGREIVVSADSAYGGTALALNSFTAESGGTTLEAEGLMVLTPRIDARINAVANRLDLDELLALADAFAPASSGSRQDAGQSPRVAANISAEEATAGGIKVRNLTTTLVRDGSSVSLTPLQFEAFGGRYASSIQARVGKQLSATIESKIENVDVAQLAAFGGSPDSVTGTLSGTGKFTGSGPDFAQLLHNASGSGSASIVNGSIRRLNLVRTVVLFFGRPAPDAGESTDRFDRLDARFSLANRVVRAEPMSLNAPDADMAGSGTLNLETDALDGRVDVTLSEALSRQAGTDLIRYTREGNRVVLPAAIGGTLKNPRLTIDVGAAAKRGLRNEVERRMKGILDGLGR